MAGTSAVRGSRIGSGPSGESVRGEPAPRVWVSYWCEQNHQTRLAFSDETPVDIPQEWSCVRCGEPAGQDRSNPPAGAKNIPFKTHMAYVLERRSEAEGQQLLDEALSALRARRGSGQRLQP